MIENLYFQLAVKEIYVYYRKVCIHIDMVTFDSKLIVKIRSNNAETLLLKTHCIRYGDQIVPDSCSKSNFLRSKAATVHCGQ